jgi:hypothetical protein
MLRSSSASVVNWPDVRNEYLVKSANSCSRSRARSGSVRISDEIEFSAL